MIGASSTGTARPMRRTTASTRIGTAWASKSSGWERILHFSRATLRRSCPPRPLVEVIVEAIDLRFRGLFNQELTHRFDRFQYQTEDLIVADYLNTVGSHRVAAALEALRVAALSTYENRRVSTERRCSAPISIRPPPSTKTWPEHLRSMRG